MAGSFSGYQDPSMTSTDPTVLPRHFNTPELSEEFFDSLSQYLATEGRAALANIPAPELELSLQRLVAEIVEPTSTFWRDHANLDQVAKEYGLHPTSLLLALETSLHEPHSRPTDRYLRNHSRGATPVSQSGIQGSVHGHRKTAPALAVLASNVPVLPLQVLAPALLARHPVLFKLPTDCATFPTAVLHALFHHLPDSRRAFAGLSWQGSQGDGSIESAIYSASPGFEPILVYGSEQAVLNHQRLAGKNSLLTYGPKTSTALIVDDGRDQEPSWLTHIARDIGLFEQRGCLSVRSIMLVGSPTIAEKRSSQLAEALRSQVKTLPLPAALSPEAAVARHWLDGALLEGKHVCGDLSTGGAVVRCSTLEATPGARTVNLVLEESLDRALHSLEQKAPHIQGVALLIEDPEGERTARRQLTGLGVERLVPPGSLQRTGLFWSNGSIDLLELLSNVSVA